MCGIACSFGSNDPAFDQNAMSLLYHRGPDDNGIFNGELISFVHTRLNILDLSYAGHQPMTSSCGRYVIDYNGEIYNHLELRKKYLSDFPFKGHSDTETLVELFRIRGEKMLTEMVGMWSILIWDTVDKRLFITRDRFGQKPLYYRNEGKVWHFSSEIKPLLVNDPSPQYDEAAVVEFLALGNYGHLGCRTFFNKIKQFPQGYFAWLHVGATEMELHQYWSLPDISKKDKMPFDEVRKKELHDVVVEAVLSQTLSDVPIGVTLSGGIDSSIITGILATYYDNNINVFTAQLPGSTFDETRYVNEVLKKYPHLKVYRHDLENLSLKDNVTQYLNIQEEPFGDPSIIAHGFLMRAAAAGGIKVILGGQGADELFFGYTNMLPAILLKQLRTLHIGDFINNINKLSSGSQFVLRTILLSVFPGIEKELRTKSRFKRRHVLQEKFFSMKDNPFESPRYNNFQEVWKESVYGIHLPHLVHYDDRNAMANSIEGRMPFLDHRIAECVARIQPVEFLKNGSRKYLLREACEKYLPDLIKKRRDKIGFHTPLVDAIYKDAAWVAENLKEFIWIKDDIRSILLHKISSRQVTINDALLIWRFLITNCWKRQFNIAG